jgi:hypothetical protein
MRPRHIRARWLALGAVVLIAVAGGVAYAAIPDSHGVIHACYSKKLGVLRVIDSEAGKTCLPGEKALTWNQKGEQGPAGPQGEPGPQGPAGQAGGSDVQVMQGSFAVAFGATGGGQTFPLTEITISGRCERIPAPPPSNEQVLALVLLDAASGATMDAFGSFTGGPIGIQSFLSGPVSIYDPAFSPNPQGGVFTALASSKGATASITVGGYVDAGSSTCRFLWQAVEAPN